MCTRRLLLLVTAVEVVGHAAAQSMNQVVECTTPSGDYGACILLESCPALIRLATMGGEGSHEALRKSTCGYIGAKPKVCCANNASPILFRDPDTTTSNVRQTERPLTTPVPTRPPQTDRVTSPPNSPSELLPLPVLPSRPAQQTNFVQQQTTFVPQQIKEERVPNTGSAHAIIPNSESQYPTVSNMGSRHPTVPNAGSQPSTLPFSGSSYPATVSQGDAAMEQSSTGSLVVIPPRRPIVNTTRVESGDVLPRPNNCGNVNIMNKIFGGEKTSVDDFPWMALLKYKTPESRQHYGCGGVLINNRYVLTAAHCIHTRNKYSLIEVRLGEWNLDTAVDCDDTVKECNALPLDLGVEETVVHPQFDIRNLTNDVALIRLSAPVTYTDWVQPICLPDSRDADYTDASFWVSGWGQTVHGTMSPVKLKLEVRHVPLDICAVAYKRLRIALGPGTMCAGGQLGKDTCAGDSGGPLMKLFTHDSFSNYHAVGIVSLGPSRCGVEGWAGVYTKVSHYINWIRSSLRP